MKGTLRRGLIALVAATCAVSTATATSRIKDLASIEGIRQNQLIGYGLVVGLNGTGDTLNNTPFTKQSLQGMLERLGVNIRGQQIRTGNVAAVMVTANLPAFATQGTRIDVTASALGDGVDVAIRAEKRRNEKGAAEEAFGIAHGGRRHVDAGALGGERRQVGGDHHRGDVAGPDLLPADVDAEPFQHALQGLLGERRIIKCVAGTVEADDEAITDQLVLANAFDVGEVFNARRAGRR